MRLDSSRSTLLAVLTLMSLFGGVTVAEAQAGDSRTFGQPVAVEGGEYRNIAPIELRAMMEQDDPSVINVHIPFAGNIPETDQSIPFNEIGENLDQLPEDKDAPVVLYCRSGPMSVRAATELVGRGYTNVYNLEGGMVAWSSAGLPLEGQ
ncbi:MAG: rhodanese-like domain-containing protein [Longimicrobiales bacterium]|nr:rhodanese-like domain-containing protein [Longimicrobiales bacterium]